MHTEVCPRNEIKGKRVDKRGTVYERGTRRYLLTSIIFPTGNPDDAQDDPLEIHAIVCANLGTSWRQDLCRGPAGISLKHVFKRQRLFKFSLPCYLRSKCTSKYDAFDFRWPV